MALPRNKKVRDYTKEELDEYCQKLLERTGKPARCGPCSRWSSGKALAKEKNVNIDNDLFARNCFRSHRLNISKKKLKPEEIGFYKDQLKHNLKSEHPILVKMFCKAENIESEDQALDLMLKETFATMDEVKTLEPLLRSSERFISRLGRKVLLHKTISSLNYEHLKEDLKNTFDWLAQFEESYIGRNLDPQEIQNIQEIALHFIYNYEGKIEEVSPYFEKSTGFYRIKITPRRGNRVLVYSCGKVWNLESGPPDAHKSTEIKPLDENDILLKIAENKW